MSGWLESVKDKVDPTAWGEAAAVAEKGGDPADLLVRGGHLQPRQLLESLSRHHDLPAILLGQYEPEEKAVALVGEDVARSLGVIPLFVVRERLYVAVRDPHDLNAEDYLVQMTGLSVERLVTTADNIEQAINRFYLAGEQTARKMETLASSHPKAPSSAAAARPAPAPLPPSPSGSVAPTVVRHEEAPSIKIVNHILASAIRLGASDIHLEPFEDSACLRYRIDGVLREYPAPPFEMMKALTSRIKIISDLDVSERRLPQDGRTAYPVDGRNWDLRVSIIPNLNGESVVIRVLDGGADRKTLADLGFSPAVFEQYLRIVTRPYGMVLVTGPTGSGKSTTTYATLRHVLTPEKKIVTLEDPVESQIKGVTQFQMNASIGLSFAHVLRSVLRHDPEIILVGEIRDLETAEIAIRAALTGHMLFSTLHTNNAASAAMRLMDMGVPGYMVLTSLLGVLAQRLVRRLCPHCKAPLEVAQGHLEALGLTRLPPDATPHRSVGCTRCEQVGHKGRIAIYEWLEVTPAMRRLAPAEMTAERLEALASQDGFVNLRRSAVEKWLQGITGLDEVMKVTLEA